MSESTQRQMEGAELELERRSKFLSSLIQKKKAVEQQDHHDLLNVRVRASDMPGPLQNRAFRCARDHLDSMPGKLDSKRLALAVKKDFDSSYGPAWHCIVGTSFGSYVTHSTGGFLYFSIDKRSLRVKKEKLEIFSFCRLTTCTSCSYQPSSVNPICKLCLSLVYLSLLFSKTENMEIPQFLGHQEHEAIDKSTEEVPILPSNAIGDTEAGPPHEALFLILTYLPLLELLSMNQVCTSLRDAVNKDVLSWLNIIVEKPLNLRLCGQILMKITSKANGRLRTLALMNCVKITDDALQRVIEQNPLINKLYLPACTGLTPEGVIRAVKTLSEHGRGLKSIMINGIYNIHKQHLETLESYLHEMNLDRQNEQPGSWPLLYHEYMDSPTFRHDKGHTTIDLEVCPKCDEVRMVFDCPRWSCKQKIERSMTECKGCKFCILRCRECGGCVDSQEIEEAVCADILCSNCWLKLPKCNFCNKPYCRRHTNNGSCASGSTGFICEVCYNKFIVNLHSIVEVVHF